MQNTKTVFFFIFLDPGFLIFNNELHQYISIIFFA